MLDELFVVERQSFVFWATLENSSIVTGSSAFQIPRYFQKV